MKLRIAVAALTVAAFGAVASADITGKVNLDGAAPEMKDIDMAGVKECAQQHPDPIQEETVMVDDKGSLANVIVAIKKAEGQELPGDVPSEPATLDQKGCMYTPHVLGMMAGQELVVKNSDPFLHNVHALSQVNPPFNFGQPNVDPGKKVDSPKAAEYFHVKCDVHPWMSAYIVAVENPYYAVSGEDGKFSLANLPPGEYTLAAWHEQLGSKEVPVKVEAGKPADVKITFAAP